MRLSAPPGTTRLTPAMVRALNKRRNKFGAKRTVVDGIAFPSKGEANRYVELSWLQKKGDIRKLKRQVIFPLVVNGVKVSSYRADFVYEDRQGVAWKRVVEDYKGKATHEYLIKRRLMLAVHGIDIAEVRRA